MSKQTICLFVFPLLALAASALSAASSTSQFRVVDAGEASAVIGGAECVDVGNYTCGGSANGCRAATCLVNVNASNPPLEVVKTGQTLLTATVCGVLDCGSVYISQDCTVPSP